MIAFLFFLFISLLFPIMIFAGNSKQRYNPKQNNLNIDIRKKQVIFFDKRTFIIIVFMMIMESFFITGVLLGIENYTELKWLIPMTLSVLMTIVSFVYYIKILNYGDEFGKV